MLDDLYELEWLNDPNGTGGLDDLDTPNDPNKSVSLTTRTGQVGSKTQTG